MTKYIYYKYTGGNVNQIEPNQHFTLKRKAPSLNTIHNVLWALFSTLSGVNFKEYTYESKGETIAKAYVMGKFPTFTFMSRRGIHIGPCYTSLNYRGNNLYPSLLVHIIKDYASKYPDIYIFTSTDNEASKRGIEKTGVFSPFAYGHKKHGIYIIDQYVSQKQ